MSPAITNSLAFGFASEDLGARYFFLLISTSTGLEIDLKTRSATPPMTPFKTNMISARESFPASVATGRSSQGAVQLIGVFTAGTMP